MVEALMERQFHLGHQPQADGPLPRPLVRPAPGRPPRRPGRRRRTIRIASAVRRHRSVIIELREWSRIAENSAPNTRLPIACVSSCGATSGFLDLGAAWKRLALELCSRPHPDRAKRVRQGSIAAILKRNRIRRLDAAQASTSCAKADHRRRRPTKAACAHHHLIDRIRLINRQISDAHQHSIASPQARRRTSQPGQAA
ncbi:MAG: hypothetical protein U1E21_02625 [Reyranellaceae bacterium]